MNRKTNCNSSLSRNLKVAVLVWQQDYFTGVLRWSRADWTILSGDARQKLSVSGAVSQVYTKIWKASEPRHTCWSPDNTRATRVNAPQIHDDTPDTAGSEGLCGGVSAAHRPAGGVRSFAWEERISPAAHGRWISAAAPHWGFHARRVGLLLSLLFDVWNWFVIQKCRVEPLMHRVCISAVS